MDVSGALAKSWDRDQGTSFRLRPSRLLPHPQREATTRLVQEGELRLSVRKTLTVTQLQRAGPGLGAQAIRLPPEVKPGAVPPSRSHRNREGLTQNPKAGAVGGAAAQPRRKGLNRPDLLGPEASGASGGSRVRVAVAWPASP